jgi:hypothetical protein
MSPDQRALLRIEEADTTAIVARPSTREAAMVEELSFVRREAQSEADMAYADWNMLSSRESYAVYRAAQDRADAAQDNLAGFVAQLEAIGA